MKKNDRALTIIIGGDMESDYEELFSAKPLKEIKQAKNMLYLESYGQLDKLLSPQKMDLLLYLIEEQTEQKPKSVSEIAAELNRHQEAISRDIASLKNLGFVFLKKFKQTVYVLPFYSKVNIELG
ncbi:MAG: HTH domain-containing protein [Candidatus Micrarchaeota archaeon]